MQPNNRTGTLNCVCHDRDFMENTVEWTICYFVCDWTWSVQQAGVFLFDKTFSTEIQNWILDLCLCGIIACCRDDLLTSWTLLSTGFPISVCPSVPKKPNMFGSAHNTRPIHACQLISKHLQQSARRKLKYSNCKSGAVQQSEWKGVMCALHCICKDCIH